MDIKIYHKSEKKSHCLEVMGTNIMVIILYHLKNVVVMLYVKYISIKSKK